MADMKEVLPKLGRSEGQARCVRRRQAPQGTDDRPRPVRMSRESGPSSGRASKGPGVSSLTSS